jgi:hypothetical protein
MMMRGGQPVQGFGVGTTALLPFIQPSAATGLYVSDEDYETAKKQWAARMLLLGQGFDAFGAAWAAKDPAAFTDWKNDWVALQARYAAALANAGAFTLNSTSYNALMKAMRACFPPSSCPTTKGDWEDLFNRLTTAGGHPQDVAGHLVAQTGGEKLFADTAKFDVVASATGEQARKTALPELDWLAAHKTALIVGGVVVGGVVVLAVLSPYAKMAAAALPRRRPAT